MLHAYIGHDLPKQYRATKCTISFKKGVAGGSEGRVGLHRAATTQLLACQHAGETLEHLKKLKDCVVQCSCVPIGSLHCQAVVAQRNRTHHTRSKRPEEKPTQEVHACVCVLSACACASFSISISLSLSLSLSLSTAHSEVCQSEHHQTLNRPVQAIPCRSNVLRQVRYTL